MSDYLRVFNFLWRLKRAEYVLSTVWVEQMRSRKEFAALKELQGEFQRANGVRHEMVLFVTNLMNYIMIEVIETNWRIFIKEVRKARDLDEIMRIHKKLIDTILEKLLLTQKSATLSKHLFALFELIPRFKHSQDVLYTGATEECHRRVLTQPVSALQPIERGRVAQSASKRVRCVQEPGKTVCGV
eukprot:TRINITY_DN12744_c0_g4_i1.p1 TRINITY_DN12744_c0_g4~~TRINITY_DN12744_c0_g4_i1.p1  ORF type:complete len:186 (+),score=34.29 TRINITY_DN12744_c0_g4_i1:351-908(+)